MHFDGNSALWIVPFLLQCLYYGCQLTLFSVQMLVCRCYTVMEAQSSVCHQLVQCQAYLCHPRDWHTTAALATLMNVATTNISMM